MDGTIRLAAAPKAPPRRLLFVGAGHAHVLVLQAFAHHPGAGLEIILVGKDRLTLSRMLPGHLAGL